jgi:hypothetical protein
MDDLNRACAAFGLTPGHNDSLFLVLLFTDFITLQ